MSEEHLNSVIGNFFANRLHKLKDNSPRQSSRMEFINFCFSFFREDKLVKSSISEIILSLKGQSKVSRLISRIVAE